MTPLEQTEKLAKSRGNRLKIMRSMLGLSRREAAELCKVGRSTFQYWEDGRGAGVSQKGAEKIIAAFQKAGLYCETSWLLYEIGNPPHLGFFESGQVSKISYVAEEESRYIVEEILLFRKHCPEAIDYQITDEGMAPQFAAGDYVAGKRYYGSMVEKCIGKVCIVELTNNKQLLRYVAQGSKPDHYTLLCINYIASFKEIALVDVRLKSAAPVLWHRKPLTQSL